MHYSWGLKLSSSNNLRNGKEKKIRSLYKFLTHNDYFKFIIQTSVNINQTTQILIKQIQNNNPKYWKKETKLIVNFLRKNIQFYLIIRYS